MVRRKIASSIFFLLFYTTAVAQNGYKGKEFWLVFPQNAITDRDGFQQSIVLTSQKTTKAVLQPGLLDKEQTFYLDPSGRYSASTSWVVDTFLCATKEGKHTASIHIISDDDITVTAFSHRRGSSDSYQILPVSKLGLEYAIIGYEPLANYYATQFDVVATQDNTLIVITFPPGSGFQDLEEVLNKGEALHYGGRYAEELPDLTGTIVRADKPIAIISGHACAQVPVHSEFCDVLIEMLPPTTALGTEHIIAKLAERPSYSIRVVAVSDSTEVWLNGVNTTTIHKGEFYQHDSLLDNMIVTTSHKAYVMQFSHGGGENETELGDPFMMLVAPTDRFIQEANFMCPIKGDWLHFMNIVTTSDGINTVKFDGAILPQRYFKQVGLTTFYAAQVEMGYGNHTLYCDKPIGVNLYGFGVGIGVYDSYGHLCGMK